MNINHAELEIKKPSPLANILPLLTVFALSFALPFIFTNVYVAIAVVAACAITIVAMSKRKFLTSIIFFAVISNFATESACATIGLILALVVGTGLFARVIDVWRSPLLAAIPVAAFAASAFILRDLAMASVSLIFALPALALFIAFKRREARVGAICLISASVFVSITAIIFCLMYKELGRFDISVLSQKAELYKAQIASVLDQLHLALPNGEAQDIFTMEEASAYAASAVSLFPAIFIIFCNAVAFFAQKLLYSFTTAAGELDKLEDRMISLMMSPVSGAIWIVSFFVSTIAATSKDYATLYTLCQNIFLIFIPGLAASGIMIKLTKIAHTHQGVWIVIPFILLAFIDISIALLLAAGLGAYYSISIPLNRFLKANSDRS